MSYMITEQQRRRYNANRVAKKAAETVQQRQQRLQRRRAYEKEHKASLGEARRAFDRQARIAYINKRCMQNPDYYKEKWQKSKLAKQRKAAENLKHLKQDQQICVRCKNIRSKSDFPITRQGKPSTMCNKCYDMVTGSFDMQRDRYWKFQANVINQKARVRLKKYNGEYTPVTAQQIREMFEKQHGKCAYCGMQLTPLIMAYDHKTPLCKDGSHNIDNLQFVCHNCNISKYTMTDEQYRKLIG